MDTRFARFVMGFPGRLAMPIAAYAGLEITGESVEDMVSVPGSQFKAVMALHDRYQTPVLLTAIDPSAEAEAYGCEVRMTEREIPTVVGRLVTNAAEIASLPDPVPGDFRTRVPLEAAWRLTAEAGEAVPVLGAMLHSAAPRPRPHPRGPPPPPPRSPRNPPPAPRPRRENRSGRPHQRAHRPGRPPR